MNGAEPGGALFSGERAPLRGGEDVTVAVVNWNGRDYLRACLAAVLAQVPTPARVVVVDNASTDGSLALVSREFPGVEVVALPENRGPGPARNRALRSAATRLVALVDNDAVLAPGALDALVRAMASGERIAACQARAVFDEDRERIHYDGGRLTLVGLQSLRNSGRRVAEAPEGDADVASLQSVALLVDRALLGEDDLFDEGYFFYFEDFDWSLRLKLKGLRCVAVAGAVAYHLSGTKGLSYREGAAFPARRAHYFTRNHLRLVAKCFAARTIAIALPALLLYEACWLLYLVLRGQGRTGIGGIRAFLRERKEARPLRAAVQRTRVVPDRALIEPAPFSLVTSGAKRGVAWALASGLGFVIGLYARCVRPLLG